MIVRFLDKFHRFGIGKSVKNNDNVEAANRSHGFGLRLSGVVKHWLDVIRFQVLLDVVTLHRLNSSQCNRVNNIIHQRAP